MFEFEFHDVTITPSDLRPEAFAKVFDAHHSQDGPPVQDHGRLLFPCGAWREVDARYGASTPPRPNPIERYRDIARYWEIRLEAARRPFEALKAKMEAGDGLHDEAALRELHRLRREVRTCQGKLSAARRKLEWHKAGCPSPEEAKRRAREEAEEDRDDEAWLDRVRKVEV